MSDSHPHRRYDPLSGQWLLVSPHRASRPWQGQTESSTRHTRPAYDPGCYLCPGNARVSGHHNPRYDGTFVFDNDFSALRGDGPHGDEVGDDGHPLLVRAGARGTCRVMCFSPRHDLTLPRMTLPGIRAVVDTWIDQLIDLGARYRWVQIFENKGAVMGCSNPHPHGQMWATEHIPAQPAREDLHQREYLDRHGRPLLVDYAALEHERADRVVVGNAQWLAVVPYWAAWPFEVLLMPRRHVARLTGLNDRERDALAEVLRALLVKYDNLFETEFPYSMGWHGAPSGSDEQTAHWQVHAHLYPPLLRSAAVKKFMVGYEMLGEAQRDLTAEHAAARLRQLSDVHYLGEDFENNV